MRAVIYAGPGSVAVVDRAVPEIGSGEVLVRNERVGLCGSDLTIIAGRHPRASVGQIIGHESVATVVATGGGVTGLAVGDRVIPEPLLPCGGCVTCLRGAAHVCEDLRLYGVEEPGALAEFTAYKAEKLHPVRGDVELDVAALVEPLAVAVHAMGRVTVTAADSVAVVGGGPIGALCAMLARSVAGEVVVAEPNGHRRTMLDRLGLTTVAALADVEGAVFDVVFECAGVAPAAQAALAHTRVRGTVVLVALHKREPVGLDLQDLSRSEKTVTGTRVYSTLDVAHAIRIVESQTVDLSRFPVAVHRLDRIEEALREAADGRRALKTLVLP
ncbi:alcohol dehydrogenase catalytic domain-containing protein [Mycobacterium sp. AMU20-3851]|uniref:zinc-dependent alcohol dehydrogenase n=1 Tax=Mycobacterium sp. AMU20-3851 TaxID=3122055 RepID=UPI0037554042